MKSQHSLPPSIRNVEAKQMISMSQRNPRLGRVLLLLLLSVAGASAGIEYSPHCNAVVPAYTPSDTPLSDFTPLALRNARVTSGGEESDASKYYSRTLFFRSKNGYGTQSSDVFKLDGVLILSSVLVPGGFRNSTTRRGLRLVHYRPPRVPVDSLSNRGRFSLSGYWNSSSRKLCMVGTGSTRFGSDSHVVLKLDYLNSSNMYTSLVNGTLASLDVDDKSVYFDALSIVGFNLRAYKYELIEKEIEQNGFSNLEDFSNVSLGSDMWWSPFDAIKSVRGFDLEYKSDCNNGQCNIFGGGSANSSLPSVLYFLQVSDLGKAPGYVRYLLTFGDGGYKYKGQFEAFDPNVMLVSEGKWDKEKKRLNMVACRIITGEEALSKKHVGDCSVRLSLRMPSWWTLRMRSAVVGEMWSSKGSNESDYFGRVELKSSSNSNVRAQNLTYEYSEMENVKKHCANSTLYKGKAGKYPGALSSDMRFDMLVTDKKGNKQWGYSSPISVGHSFYQQKRYFRWSGWQGNSETHNISGMVNISYVINFGIPPNPIKSTEISAEGLYDSESGRVCMTGCKPLKSHDGKFAGSNASLDCDILINIQYASLNSKRGTNVKGSIESTRKTSDPLYFETLHLSSRSIYTGQVRRSMWRMDFEITMVLISNTLTCLFVGLQLFHVKKNPSVCSSVSVVMLVVLTLAHMIPLLLNFEALFFTNRNRQSFYFGSDGWLEVNEVLVRLITMIAFLLEFRLLQLAWSARGEDPNSKSLWTSDKKVLYLSLPLYITGALISWFVYVSGKPYRSPYRNPHYRGYQTQSLWGGLKSYAGLILDTFLLPQVLFNLFRDSRDKVLAPSFYVGTTLVRLLPHAYDLYRARTSAYSFSYIYANPRMDYYSTGWDIIISILGLVLVLLIFLQQHFGGRCLIPPCRFRQGSAYDKVPVVNSDEL